MDHEQLLCFCYHGEDRPSLTEPFNQYGFTWASDGRILVRVPPSLVYERLDRKGPEMETFLKVLDHHSGREVVIPNLPEPQFAECTDCGGTGKCEQVADVPCFECDGVARWRKTVSVNVGGVWFSDVFLELIRPLPGVRFFVDESPPHEKSGWRPPAKFTFEGGDGLLMPMTDKAAEGIPYGASQVRTT